MTKKKNDEFRWTWSENANIKRRTRKNDTNKKKDDGLRENLKKNVWRKKIKINGKILKVWQLRTWRICKGRNRRNEKRDERKERYAI